jgi:hypothetical protein
MAKKAEIEKRIKEAIRRNQEQRDALVSRSPARVKYNYVIHELMQLLVND